MLNYPAFRPARWRRRALAALSGVVVWGVAACAGPSDRPIAIVNRTDQAVFVEAVGRAITGQSVRAQPGQTLTPAWSVVGPQDEGRSMRILIQAVDERGTVIYRDRYKLDEIKRQDWTIQIVEGHLDCAPVNPSPPWWPTPRAGRG